MKYHTNKINKDFALEILIENGFINENMANNILDDIILNPGKHLLPIWGFMNIRDIYLDYKLKKEYYFHRDEFWLWLVKEGAIPINLLRKNFQTEFNTKPLN
jgi:hypothetical protein